MATREITYPVKKLGVDDSGLTVRRFILPIRIRGVPMWGLLDTGAGISILPKEVASRALDLNISQDDSDLRYTVAGLIDVPYESHTSTVQILDYIPNTISNFEIMPYHRRGKSVMTLPGVDFKIPTMKYPEIASHVETEDPIDLEEAPMEIVILGMHGFLEHLHLSFTGDNAVTVSKRSA